MNLGIGESPLAEAPKSLKDEVQQYSPQPMQN